MAYELNANCAVLLAVLAAAIGPLGSSCSSDNQEDCTGGYKGGGASTLEGIDTTDLGFANLATPTVLSSFDTAEWGAGTIDESLRVEGTGSLRWEHALDADGCFEYGGQNYCYLRLEPETPLDLSDKEFVSMWIHNDTRSAYNTTCHETYEESVLDWIYLSLVYEGGSHDALVRLEHEGWRQFSFEKGLFSGEESEGWGAITRIDMFVSDAHNPITERVVHLDYLTASTLPPGNVPARFLSTFESGSYEPDIGSRLVLGQHVYDEDNNISMYHLDYTTVVDNPYPSERNHSSKVFMSHVPQEGYIRAEYEATHVATEGKAHIYAWKEYLPSTTFDDIDYHFLALGQWKTYPCEVGNGTYADTICGGGGIFNDRALVYGDPSQVELRFRAEPSCYEAQYAYETDVWTAYALEIYWTRDETGYYRLYRDGELLSEKTGIKTLFDNFEPGTCDMKWAMGVYSRWWSTGAEDLTYYLDDMAIFDLDHGVTMDEVLAWQQL